VPRSLATPEAFLERVPVGAVVAGAGAELHADALRRVRPGLAFSGQPAELAASVAALGLAALEAGGGTGPEELRPAYLRAPAMLLS
jgi:tRNA A37 threonylcarbamoyladenosine modification protein TsaB